MAVRRRVRLDRADDANANDASDNDDLDREDEGDGASEGSGFGELGVNIGEDLGELRDPVDQWIRDSLADPPLAWRLGDDGIGMLTGAGAVLLVALGVAWWLWRQHVMRTAAQLRAASLMAQPPTVDGADGQYINADAMTAARVGEPTIAQEDASAHLYRDRSHPAIAGIKAAAAAALSHGMPDTPAAMADGHGYDDGDPFAPFDGADLTGWEGAS